MSQGHDETENKESNFELPKSSGELSTEKESTEFDNEETLSFTGEDSVLVWLLHTWFLFSDVIFQIFTRDSEDMMHETKLIVNEQNSKMWENSGECC